MQLFQQGSRYYLAQQYERRSGLSTGPGHRKSFADARKKKLWYVLVDNLAMAYGIKTISRIRKRCSAYGISKDPSYRCFNYKPGMHRRGKGDAQSAKANLKTRVRTRSHALPARTIPGCTHEIPSEIDAGEGLPTVVDSLYGGKSLKLLEKHWRGK